MDGDVPVLGEPVEPYHGAPWCPGGCHRQSLRGCQPQACGHGCGKLSGAVRCRFPTLPVAELQRHTAPVNALAWAPHSSCHICTAGDDAQALIWDLSSMSQPLDQDLGAPYPNPMKACRATSQATLRRRSSGTRPTCPSRCRHDLGAPYPRPKIARLAAPRAASHRRSSMTCPPGPDDGRGPGCALPLPNYNFALL